MGLRVHTNAASSKGHSSLREVTERRARSCRRLSAGLRISTGADETTGVAISERLRSQIRSHEQARHKTGDGISLVRTAESALDEVSSILTPLRRLSRPAEFSLVTDIDAAIHMLAITDENVGAAESRIRDVAVACEIARLTRDSILQQASTAVMSQANALPQSALRLLGGSTHTRNPT